MSEQSPAASDEQSEDEWAALHAPSGNVRFIRLEMTNFLSYKHGVLELGDFVALVGPNASGKSNAVSALKLLREISVYGLPIALARRGGFDQLRHRSAGRPYDPSLRITFSMGDAPDSFYELQLGAVKGGRYRIKKEHASVHMANRRFTMLSNGEEVEWDDADETESGGMRKFKVAPGQSALASGGLAGYVVYDILRVLQTVEVNPAKVSDLQEPSSTREFEPDGSNTVSVYENLSPRQRRRVSEELATIVPNIEAIEVLNLADRQTLRFKQKTESGNREFYAKQMSDGTLRAFAILLAAQQSEYGLLVIEEPEVAIHLGALRTLVELLRSRSPKSQTVITTHSADIVDALPIDDIRVVWSQGDASHIAPIAEHSKATIRRGLITPGELLRSDSLDPAASL